MQGVVYEFQVMNIQVTFNTLMVWAFHMKIKNEEKTMPPK